MDQREQREWITRHIPHRVRAAIARLPMENSLLHVNALIDPKLLTVVDKVYWRCSTDAIWEGRLVATRWLIEFIGIKPGANREPVSSRNNRKTQVYIDDFDGGSLFDPARADAGFLADIWMGCTVASSHATNVYDHPPVHDRVLPRALKVILNHLQSTIYDAAGKKIRDYVLKAD